MPHPASFQWMACGGDRGSRSVPTVPRLAAPFVAILLAACGGDAGVAQEPVEGGAMMELGSSAFSEGDTVPTEFTCDGDNVSPPLGWSGVPEDAAELRIGLRDPDAPGGNFTHWLVTGIDPSSSEVGRGRVPAGGTEEMNSFGKRAYGGPCPPRGDNPHRYIFTIEALDAAGNVLARGELTTTYGR
jgi:Raf kinase inhibitor-like YbhB/YbcL family protein